MYFYGQPVTEHTKICECSAALVYNKYDEKWDSSFKTTYIICPICGRVINVEKSED